MGLSEGPVGPVDIVLLGFPGNQFRGEIIPAIARLVDNGTVRIIDAVVVKKDADGTVEALELTDLGDDAGPFAGVAGDIGALVSDDDIEAAASALDPNSTAALLVFENTWAAEVVQAVQNADGMLLMHERVPAAIVQAALDDLQANPDPD